MLKSEFGNHHCGTSFTTGVFVMREVGEREVGKREGIFLLGRGEIRETGIKKCGVHQKSFISIHEKKWLETSLFVSFSTFILGAQKGYNVDKGI